MLTATSAISRNTVSIYSTDLEFPTDTDGRCATQLVGVRFESVHLPPRATIQSAHIQFTVDEVRTESSFSVTLR